MATANTLIIASTNTAWIEGLCLNGETYPIDATVVLTKLMDATGATVTGTTNISMPYISGVGANSIYRGAIPSSVVLTAQVYTAVVTVTIGSNVRVFTLPATAST